MVKIIKKLKKRKICIKKLKNLHVAVVIMWIFFAFLWGIQRGDEHNFFCPDCGHMFNYYQNKIMQTEFKYADLLDDDAFKLVFGQESTKDVMIEFLNRVLDDGTIVDLDFMDKEMHPSARDSKASVYDLFCKKDDGSRIIVELQKRKQDSYAERMLYYSMHQVLKQVGTGNDSFDFCPIYVISILDFTIDQNDGHRNVKTVYRLLEERHKFLLTDRY